MSFGPLEIQTWTFTQLNGDATLQTLLGGVNKVFDNVPDSQPFPFVVIGENEHVDRGSHTTEGLDSNLTIKVWARERGRKQALDIQKRIDELIHKVEPTITGWHSITLRRDFSTVLVEEDNVTYQGIQRFKLLTGGD